MATIQKRKNQNGTNSYRVMIRPNDGLPTTYKTFPTFQEAKDWSIQEEARRRQGIYFPEQLKKRHTLSELVDRYIELMSSEKVKSAEDILRHLNWWKGKIGKFTLNHITPDLIAKYRKELIEGHTPQGELRTSATTNRYLASLSGVLSYGVKECGWISVNPMLRVSKLKEARGRERVLTKEECERLLSACAQSKSPFLLTVVTLAISTGMRQGEILGLTWDNVDLNQSQTAISKQIIDGQGDYVLGLKGNQWTLHAEAVNFFEQAIEVGAQESGCGFSKRIEKNHGRIEEREVWITTNLEWLENIEEWANLRSLICVKSTRSEKGKTTEEKRYYISSLQESAERMGEVIRQHWGIENKLHWHLDVTFNEDRSKIRTGHGAENFSLLKRCVLNLVKADTKNKDSIMTKRRMAAWNPSYRLQLLGVK